MNGMANSGSGNVNVNILVLRFPSLTSQLRVGKYASCNSKCAFYVHLLCALLNFAFRSPFYDINNSHDAAVQKRIDNAAYLQLLTQYWGYRKSETWS
jgi:hypothetical protein